MSPLLPYNRPRWWRSPFLWLALLGGISLGWLWWESSHQGRGIGWVSSSGRRYFASHGAGWLYLGAVDSDWGPRGHRSLPSLPPQRFEPWMWDQKMAGEHLRWFPPLAVMSKEEHELRRLGFCYWFLLSGYLGLCLGSGLWWRQRRRRQVAACLELVPDEKDEMQ